MLSEFKTFIARGNVLDLAVGVIIGAGFGKIVSSLTDDVIMPVIAAAYVLTLRLLGLIPWLALRVRLPLMAAGSGALVGIGYTLLTGAEVPVPLRADADQLTQVFHNLVENAVKYGTPGKLVTVSLRRITDVPGLKGPCIEVNVADQGEGIDPIHLPRLTERFYRVDTHRSREKGGTGLGLAIVKHIINRHRGRLRITSEKGKGSTFTVILPMG